MLKKARYLILASCLITLAGCTSSSGGDDDDDDNGSGSNGSSDSNGGGSVSDDPSTGGDSDGGDSSGGGGGSSGTRMVNKVGTVGLVEGDTGFSHALTASGAFLGYTDPFEVPADDIDFYGPLVGTCTVSTSDDGDFTPPELEPEDTVDGEFLDAGAGLTITSNGEEFLELVRLDLGNGSNIFYTSQEAIPPMPEGLRLTIPGAEFPAFSNIPIKTLAPAELLSPTGGAAVRFDTEFTWQGSNDPDVLVFIDASAFDTNVSCIASDTGSFEFPQDTRNELGTGFFASDYGMSRFAYGVHFKDDAALLVFSATLERSR